MRIKLFFFVITLFLLGAAGASAQSNTSIYTALEGPTCRTLESNPNEGGSYLGQCTGIMGYKLQVAEGDIRQNLIVVTPAGKKVSLELWNVVGHGFSNLGPRAEWRVVKVGKRLVPVALIVRYTVANPEDSSKSTSYLVVAKITPAKICVTDAIKPSADANEKARVAADNSADKACKEASSD